jgi:hypothetical protein
VWLYDNGWVTTGFVVWMYVDTVVTVLEVFGCVGTVYGPVEECNETAAAAGCWRHTFPYPGISRMVAAGAPVHCQSAVVGSRISLALCRCL